MVTIPGTRFDIPARIIVRRPTTQPTAWLGDYVTVELEEEIVAMRVHVNGGGEGAWSNSRRAFGAGLRGRWLAIGDFVHTYDEYVRRTALPDSFTHQALVTCFPGTVLNIGRCAPLFGRPGGGEQAELVEGPACRYHPIEGFWSRFAGNA